MERRRLLSLLGVSTLGVTAGSVAASDGASREGDPDGLVTVESDESVPETVDRIERAIEESPMALVTTVDHAENAATVDRELPPTTLLLFGNPDAGTPLMDASRTIGIDLPQRMLVWEDESDGTVYVTYNDPAFLADRHGIDGEDERLADTADALESLATGEIDGE
ncbi:DUF302 domain-containing protein [Natrialbaceae archaeon A-gly3]